MKVMGKIIKSMVRRIANDLIKDSNYLYKPDKFNVVLAAYNRYCEDEKDGIDYLFNIYDQDDLKCLVNKGMTAMEIAEVYDKAQYEKSNYFFCDCNHDVQTIPSFEDVVGLVIAMLDEVCENALLYVTRCKEYQALYERYVTDTYLEYKDAESLRDKTRFKAICDEIGYNPNEEIDALAALKKKMDSM